MLKYDIDCRWGPGYTGAEDPLSLLRDVIEAEEIRLDRSD